MDETSETRRYNKRMKELQTQDEAKRLGIAYSRFKRVANRLGLARCEEASEFTVETTAPIRAYYLHFFAESENSSSHRS
jgi:hypothetical protein